MIAKEATRSRFDIRGLRYVAQRLGLLFLFACELFGSAGTVSWARGWCYLLVVLLLEALTLSLLLFFAPETLNQRGTFGAGIKPFDKVFVVFWLVFALITPVVAGLDAARFHWSTLPWPFFYVGLVLLTLASLFGNWAMLENKYFEQFVRIQEERGHRVITTGPYRVIRHPGYLGAILGSLATPLILGSVWTFIPASLMALLFIVRTDLEDHTLMGELQDFKQYAHQTRFRLVPWVW